MIINEWIFAYLALGMLTGFLAGLFGIGGGAIMVPVLSMIFAALGMPPEHILHLSLGTSMATIIFTALSSIRAHHNHDAVLWPVVRQITPGILVGTWLGTLVAARISSHALAILFSVFMLYVAFNMWVALKPKPSRELPGALAVSAVGTGIGALSALVAIGGGTMTVPFLTWCNVRVQTAIGTSAAVGLPIAIGGTLGYIWNGWHAPGLPAGSVGFVLVPALVFLTLSSMLTAPLGARLAHRLPVQSLRRAFAVLIIALCVKMLYGIFTHQV